MWNYELQITIKGVAIDYLFQSNATPSFWL